MHPVNKRLPLPPPPPPQRIPSVVLRMSTLCPWQGSPKLTSTCTVKVTILDRNDNPPVFSGLFSVAVPEDLPPGSLILTLTSTDRDTPNNANATYRLVAGPESLPFAVDAASGNVTTVVELDAETRERYRPDVDVTDSSYAARTQVTIRLLDVNDNAPRFLRQTWSFQLREGQSPGTEVGQLQADDRDISSPNDQFYFSLKRPSTLFELDAESGRIRALRSLEYQRTEEAATPSSINTHTLEVLVTDLGMPSLSSQATVTISITDANNHAPVFASDDYVSAVPENAAQGLSVLTVEARDELDFGLNADIVYSVSGGNGSAFFMVDGGSGVVSVSRSLSGRTGQDFLLVVTASDRGDPPQSEHTIVQLSVTDVNRYAPDFRNPVYTNTVQEDVDVGYTIVTFSASDRDSGLNKQVRFSIARGNEDGLFDLDPVTGRLTVAKPLDYEKERRHMLNITARDMGLISLSTSRVYTINLVDVNDNSPHFNQSLYNAFVPENSPRDTLVLSLQADDADSGNNGNVRYAVTGDAAAQSHFSIDASSGNVRVKGDLDYETRDTYTLTIMAYNPSGGAVTPSCVMSPRSESTSPGSTNTHRGSSRESTDSQ